MSLDRSKQKRKRIKNVNTDSDSDDNDKTPNSQGTPGKKGRKNIRKVIKDKQVADDTKQAAKEEEERLKRIAERQKLVLIFNVSLINLKLNQICSNDCIGIPSF